MSGSCEKIPYRAFSPDRHRLPLPAIYRFVNRPLLDVSRLPAPLSRKTELVLALGVVGVDNAKRLIREKPLHVSLVMATVALAAGVYNVAYTYWISR